MYLNRYKNVFKTNSKRLQDVLQTSSRSLPRHLQDVLPRRVSKTSSRRIGKISSRRFAKISSRRPQNVFKTSRKNVFKKSSRRLQDVLETSTGHLQDILETSSKDVFKTFSRRIIRLNCLPRSRFLQVTLLRNLQSVQKICKCDKNF